MGPRWSLTIEWRFQIILIRVATMEHDLWSWKYPTDFGAPYILELQISHIATDWCILQNIC